MLLLLLLLWALRGAPTISSSIISIDVLHQLVGPSPPSSCQPHAPPLRRGVTTLCPRPPQVVTIMWQVLLCVMLFFLANLIKSVLAKVLSTNFLKTAHFKTVWGGGGAGGGVRCVGVGCGVGGEGGGMRCLWGGGGSGHGRHFLKTACFKAAWAGE